MPGRNGERIASDRQDQPGNAKRLKYVQDGRVEHVRCAPLLLSSSVLRVANADTKMQVSRTLPCRTTQRRVTDAGDLWHWHPRLYHRVTAPGERVIFDQHTTSACPCPRLTVRRTSAGHRAGWKSLQGLFRTADECQHHPGTSDKANKLHALGVVASYTDERPG